MNVLIVNFALRGLDPESYRLHCEQIAPIFADLPGLISKTWLANPEMNTYGGLYLWRDREALENYLASNIFKSLAVNPYLSNITARQFPVVDGPTRLTRGAVADTTPPIYRQSAQAYETRWPQGGFPGRP